VLIGKNIRLQAMTAADAPLIAEWFSDPAYMGEFNNVWPQTRAAWEQVLGGRRGGHDDGMFLIVGRETGEPMGAIGYWNPFTNADFFKGYEIWYQVHPAFRRRGLATQATCLLINHLFAAMPVPRIQATVAVENMPSCRVTEAAGMQRDGVYRQVTFLHGRWMDMYLYAIVRGDWGDEATYRQGRPPF
jgi:ribosomal-protein-alanine N-acetyltransferase